MAYAVSSKKKRISDLQCAKILISTNTLRAQKKQYFHVWVLYKSMLFFFFLIQNKC